MHVIFLEGTVLKPVQCRLDIVSHGEIDHLFLIIPFDAYDTLSLSFQVCLYLIMLLYGIYQVVYMLFLNIFDPEVINHQ